MTEPPTPRRALLDHPFVRFLMVGGLSYLIDVGTLVGLDSGLGLPLAVATTGAYLAAFCVTFTLNRLWVFDAGDGSSGGQVLRYFVLVGVNYVLTLVIVLGLVGLGLAPAVAKTISVAVLAVLNFFLYRSFVFGSGTSGPDAADTLPGSDPGSRSGGVS